MIISLVPVAVATCVNVVVDVGSISGVIDGVGDSGSSMVPVCVGDGWGDAVGSGVSVGRGVLVGGRTSVGGRGVDVGGSGSLVDVDISVGGGSGVSVSFGVSVGGGSDVSVGNNPGPPPILIWHENRVKQTSPIR